MHVKDGVECGRGDVLHMSNSRLEVVAANETVEVIINVLQRHPLLLLGPRGQQGCGSKAWPVEVTREKPVD